MLQRPTQRTGHCEGIADVKFDVSSNKKQVVPVFRGGNWAS